MFFNWAFIFKRNVDLHWTFTFLIFKSNMTIKHMYIVSHNLKIFFKWISNTASRKWRHSANSKNVGKIKMWILCMDVIYRGKERMGGWGWGAHKLTSKGRFPSSILNFESPLTKSIIYMCRRRNHCIAVRYKRKQ